MTHRIVDPNSDSAEPSQVAAVALLADPATHCGNPVVRIDTPISHVFIAGPDTYKMKRAVKRNFVDYSTVEKRRTQCQREVEINTVYAPGIYKGVVPIVRTESGLQLGGDGEAVDYVVAMATFDPAQTFDRLVETGKLTRRLARDLADVIADMHRKAPRASQFGGSQNVAETIAQVADAILDAAAGRYVTSHVRAWRSAAETALATHRDQIDARRRHGYVRRCHGDLHLANICLFEDKPTPFDAIEFSDEIASVDVLYDLAFTVMDLLKRSEKIHANTLVSRYLNITRDYSGLALLPLFMSLRAAVRAMVAASNDDIETGTADACARLQFALRCLGNGHTPQVTRNPMLIAIGGLSGSGKSTLARRLAPAIPGLCGAMTIRSDVCRKRLFGVGPEEPLPDTAYTPDISQRVFTLLMRDAARALRSGTSVILDATFIEGEKTANLEVLARRAGATFAGLWLSLDLPTLQERIGKRGADASDATPAVAAAQWQSVRENPAWVKLDASRTPAEVEAQARAAIGLQPSSVLDRTLDHGPSSSSGRDSRTETKI